jgi:hypothetical protein
MVATYDLSEEPRGSVYRGLIRASLNYGASFLLVVRSLLAVHQSVRLAMEDLEPFVVSRTDESEWPGTRLFDETASVSRFLLRSETARILGKVADGLYEWVQPDLPEDLCIMRADGSPWLVTISHEREAYLQLSDYEKKALLEEVPTLLLANGDK